MGFVDFAETPLSGTRVEAGVGGQAHLKLGASDQQHTQVDLVFRWRTATGAPLASAPEGWSCDPKRGSGGAVEADCTSAPTASADVSFLDRSSSVDESRCGACAGRFPHAFGTTSWSGSWCRRQGGQRGALSLLVIRRAADFGRLMRCGRPALGRDETWSWITPR